MAVDKYATTNRNERNRDQTNITRFWTKWGRQRSDSSLQKLIADDQCPLSVVIENETHLRPAVWRLTWKPQETVAPNNQAQSTSILESREDDSKREKRWRRESGEAGLYRGGVAIRTPPEQANNSPSATHIPDLERSVQLLGTTPASLHKVQSSEGTGKWSSFFR